MSIKGSYWHTSYEYEKSRALGSARNAAQYFIEGTYYSAKQLGDQLGLDRKDAAYAVSKHKRRKDAGPLTLASLRVIAEGIRAKRA